jgi:hypothetical protein
MAPKARSAAPTTTGQTSTPQKASSSKSANSQDATDIIQGVWNNYLNKTPQRVKLLDTFMAFLVVVGALQFLYVVIVGNFVRSLCSHLPEVRRLTALYCSLLTLFSPVLAQQSANSSSQQVCASRRTLRTRRTSRAFRTSVRLRIMCSAVCSYTSFASTSSIKKIWKALGSRTPRSDRTRQQTRCTISYGHVYL